MGRLVIPKELRERYALKKEIELIATEQGILIKNPEYVLSKKEYTNPWLYSTSYALLNNFDFILPSLNRLKTFWLF